MTSVLKIGCVLVFAAFTLTACDDSDDDDSSSSGDPQDEIGATFADAFDADENAEPIDPVEGDAGEASLTEDPLEL